MNPELVRGIATCGLLITGCIILFYLMAKSEKKQNMDQSKKYREDGFINENWFAEKIAEREGKTEQVDIGQIKEIIKLTFEELYLLSHKNQA